MDIQLHKSIGLDLLEYCERFPSMRFRCEIKIDYLYSALSFEYDSLWVESSVWDNWLKQIKELDGGDIELAELSDLDQDFYICVTKSSPKSYEMRLSVTVKEIGKPEAKLNLLFALSLDCFAKLLASSEDFPIMW
ncbi:hypothetical protein [Thalassomonas sp. RHCl1]|uniref:hypothetical protein n=1 Tax=Thalassomonas sp. RHCl1 TaxID=2995320 RepID=UPI00248A975A|nr:hypothetical protein [Thalassomonas sp. RHCl1]